MEYWDYKYGLIYSGFTGIIMGLEYDILLYGGYHWDCKKLILVGFEPKQVDFVKISHDLSPSDL